MLHSHALSTFAFILALLVSVVCHLAHACCETRLCYTKPHQSYLEQLYSYVTLPHTGTHPPSLLDLSFFLLIFVLCFLCFFYLGRQAWSLCAVYVCGRPSQSSCPALPSLHLSTLLNSTLSPRKSILNYLPRTHGDVNTPFRPIFCGTQTL